LQYQVYLDPLNLEKVRLSGKILSCLTISHNDPHGGVVASYPGSRVGRGVEREPGTSRSATARAFTS